MQEAVKRHLAPEGRLDYVHLFRDEGNIRMLEIDGIYVISERRCSEVTGTVV